MNRIELVEVGPRDGLQNESKILSVQQRLELIEKLVLSGARRIEIGAFVSPRWVPQMKDTSALVERIKTHSLLAKAKIFNKLSVLTPNLHGFQQAAAHGLKQVAIFGSCSELFSKKNINCSIEESFDRFAQILKLAQPARIAVRGYLSMAFGCPYEGAIPEHRVVQLSKRLKKLGVFEISIGDTIGVADPYQVESLIRQLKKAVGVECLAMHFHDTRGTALANILKAVEMGVRVFDASIGGLGGCPYANGASGNVATEDVQYMLQRMGYKTKIKLDSLIAVAKYLEPIIEKTLPSKLSKIADRSATHFKTGYQKSS